MKEFRIAITGSIGTGKSVVSEFYCNLGYEVIDADSIAKEIYSTDSSVRKKIIDTFGHRSYSGDEPNLKFLADAIFSDPKKVKIINRIVHPEVIKKIKNLMDSALKKNSIVFVEAALIFEAGMENIFDYVMLITAEDKLKISRVMERDGVDESEVRRRLDNQMPEDQKRARADFIITNDSTLEVLYEKCRFFLRLFNRLSSKT